MPSDELVASPDRCVVALAGPSELLLVVLDDEPVNVKVLTVPMLLKNGTTVNRTNRRSLETTACTLRNVPSERTTITGCWAAAKSPTTGMTVITNGLCVVSDTNACWPLNSVTLGACMMFDRRSSCTACMKK